MTKRLFPGAVALAAILHGCGGGSATTTGSGGGQGSGGGDAGTGKCGAGVDVSGCSQVVAPSGGDDTKNALAALISVPSSGTVCFCPGNFSFSQQLSLTVPNVTVKGLGKANTDTVLDFSKDTVAGAGNDTMLVTADGFTIENLWVKNTPGNGVVVRQSDKPTFQNLKVSWDAPDPHTHGAYAIYPAECTNVLVQNNEVVGAADAAIYVGQGNGAIIRHNKAHDSVLGIELENTTNGEAYDNETYNNSGGMAVFLLGDLDKKTADSNLVHDNNIHDNNGVNFGNPSEVVSHVPVGTGIIVVASSNTELRDNTITNNESVGILAVSYKLMAALIPGATADPAIDPYIDGLYVHGNTFMGNGGKPQAPVSLISGVTGVLPVENVAWDGWVASGMPADGSGKLCLGSMGPYPTFIMFAGDHLTDADMGKAESSTSTTPYQCDGTTIPGNPP